MVSGHSPAVPHHCPDVEKIRPIADRLAWRNDSEGNDLFDGYPGPSWDADRFEPSDEAAAQESGWRLGYELAYLAMPPADLTDALKDLWWTGKAQGIEDRQEDDAAWAALNEEMMGWDASRADRHPSEQIRAFGVLVSRQEGGVA